MQKRSPFSLYANYNDAVSNLAITFDGYEKDGIARAEMTMYPPLDTKEGDKWSIIFFKGRAYSRGKDSYDSRRPDPAQWGDKIHNSSKGRLRRKWRPQKYNKETNPGEQFQAQ